jgi:transcriptional regulator with XRE-family HTH domain
MLLAMADTRDRRGTVTDENRAESARLRAIWESDAGIAIRRKAGCYSQGDFGEAYGIGNQAAVGFFLNGKTAISLKAALAFARGLGCRVEEFSERLAELAKTNEPSAWPFQMVARERFDALTERQKGLVEAAMLSAIEQIEATRVPVDWHSSGGVTTDRPHHNPTHQKAA